MSSRDFAMQFETSSNKKHEQNQRRVADFRFLPSLPKEYMGMSQIVASTPTVSKIGCANLGSTSWQPGAREPLFSLPMAQTCVVEE